MEDINKYIRSLEIGKVQKYKNMALIPLLGGNGDSKSNLDYLVFDEAVNQGLDVKETGSIPTLNFKNGAGKEVLILRGEYVEGGKQNRMVTRNIYMAKDFAEDVSVNCVQQGRWSSGRGEKFKSAARRATPTLAFASLSGQGEVWGQVSRMTASHNVSSPTENLEEIFKGKEKDVNDYLNNFSAEENTVGIIVVTEKNGNKVYGLDIFDQTRTLEKNFSKLIESYALEALERNGSDDKIKQTKRDAARFLRKISDCQEKEQKAVSLARDILIQGDGLQGEALIFEGLPLYINLATRSTSEGDILGRGGSGVQRRSTGFSRRGYAGTNYGQAIDPLQTIIMPLDEIRREGTTDDLYKWFRGQ